MSSNEGNNIYSDIEPFVSVVLVNDDLAYTIDKFYLLKYKLQPVFSQMEQKFLCSQHDQSSRMICIFKLLLIFIYDRKKCNVQNKNSSILFWEKLCREIDVFVWLTCEISKKKFFICHCGEKKVHSFSFHNFFMHVTDSFIHTWHSESTNVTDKENIKNRITLLPFFN